MRVIRNFKELKPLDADLTKYILEVCPWLIPDWKPHETGIIYILQNNSRYHNWILTQPHFDGKHCRDRISVKMATRNLWKPPAYFNETLGYWHVVAVFYEDYEGNFFLSAEYVQSIPELEEIFQDIR